MTKLRPPDGRVFVSLDKKYKYQMDVTITAVGNGVDLEVGKKVCVVGKMQRVELQDIEIYSVSVDNIAFLYE
jgi:NAD-dependent DNA ligase